MIPIASLHLDWAAMAIGTIGTILWAHGGPSARFAGPLWLVSSLIWLAYSWINGLHALALRDLFNVAIYVYGLRQWLAHRLRKANSSTHSDESPP